MFSLLTGYLFSLVADSNQSRAGNKPATESDVSDGNESGMSMSLLSPPPLLTESIEGSEYPPQPKKAKLAKAKPSRNRLAENDESDRDKSGSPRLSRKEHVRPLMEGEFMQFMPGTRLNHDGSSPDSAAHQEEEEDNVSLGTRSFAFIAQTDKALTESVTATASHFMGQMEPAVQGQALGLLQTIALLDPEIQLLFIRDIVEFGREWVQTIRQTEFGEDLEVQDEPSGFNSALSENERQEGSTSENERQEGSTELAGSGNGASIEQAEPGNGALKRRRDSSHGTGPPQKRVKGLTISEGDSEPCDDGSTVTDRHWQKMLQEVIFFIFIPSYIN
jgi:hypothetical protein